ncbi:hypothetical protein LB504_004064 [Fusarium proliferatum]|nr:hypothetical protein LB504_004064 [Fusarium proliferatum]
MGLYSPLEQFDPALPINNTKPSVGQGLSRLHQLGIASDKELPPESSGRACISENLGLWGSLN